MTLAPEVGLEPGYCLPRIDDHEARNAFYASTGLWTEERIGWLIANNAQRWPDREFVCIDDERLTYAEFSGWADAVGARLLSAGVRPGERVLIQLPNRIEALVAQVAAFRVGMVAAPVVPIYREREMRHILADCRPAAIVSVDQLGDRRPADEIAAQLDELGRHAKACLVAGGAADGWEAFPGRESRVDPAKLPDPLPAEECALILYTSGTTSKPKGVCLSSRSLLSNGRSLRLASGLSSETVFFTCAPLSHLAGFNSGLLWPGTVGGRVVIMSAWDAGRAAQVIDRERASFTSGASVFLHDLVGVYRSGGHEHRLSVFMSGGAPTPPTLIEEAESLGMKAFRAYGMTETAGGVTYASQHDEQYRKAGFDAKVGFGSEMEAVDPDRRRLPAGEHGELRIRSPQLLMGYTDPELTAAQFDADGWFYSGDVGSVDAEGWLTISGRVKDIINRAGEKFSARDIEEAIISHSSVEDAAVVGLPDVRMGEIVGAFVILRAGVEWWGPQSLTDHLKEQQIARQKIPVEWYVMGELPRSASGKLQKHELVTYRQQKVAESEDDQS